MQIKPIKSFREYVDILKQHNDVVSITQEVDWDLEMSAIARRAYDLPAPAPLFKNIKGCTPGFEKLGAPVGLSPGKYPYLRVALSLGLPIDTPPPAIVEAWSYLPDVKPIPPRAVETAVCKENKLFGDEIDLTKMPWPFIHVGDGGRYVNTYGMFIVATPDGRWVNWAISRAMLEGPRTMAGSVIGAQGNFVQDFGTIYNEWKKIGKDMPYALVIGADPGIMMAAGYPIPEVNEADIIGGWYGEPIDVIKCETNDLYVPAASEIVIEGVAAIEDIIPEGPMGEYGGYVWAATRKQAPRFHVNCVTHRNNPIIPFTVAGYPAEENHTNWGIAIAASIQNALRKKGLPVKQCFIPMESAVHWCVVTIDRAKQQIEDDAELCLEIGKTAFATKAGSYVPQILVMDDDIDSSNIAEVVWALATRHHPDNRIIIPGQRVIPLVSYLKPEEKLDAATGKVVYNCLMPSAKLPKDQQHVAAKWCGYPEELRKHVINNWEKYGF